MKTKIRSKGHLAAFIVTILGLTALCIDDYISVKAGGIGLYSWITRILIKCCFIAQGVIYFTQYKKAKALEESEDKSK